MVAAGWRGGCEFARFFVLQLSADPSGGCTEHAHFAECDGAGA